MKNFFTIYDKYIFKQVSLATIVAILLFIVVWIAPEELLNTIKHVLDGSYTPKVGIFSLIYEIPKILGKALPVGLLLGTLFTFDKLSKDSELTIFRAVGMSFWRILAPIIVLGIIVTGLCFVTCDKLIPYACHKEQVLKDKSGVTQFIYSQKDENNHPVRAVVVSKFHRKVMQDVIVMNFAETVFDDLHGLKNVLVAEKGEKGQNENGEPCWKLYNITSYDISDEGIFKEITSIKQMDVLTGDYANNAYNLMINSTKKDRDINNRDLRKYVNLLKKEDMDEEYRLNLNKYYQRFLHPLVCILLGILGALLGFSKPREQRLIGFTIAIGCIFAYYITLPFFDLLAEKGILNPFITAAFPPFAFMIAIYVFYKSKDL